jgi:tyrosyl-tRNA synthetase
VEQAAAALFGKDPLDAIDPDVFAQALAELPHAQVSSGTSVAQALVDSGLCASLSEARRAIAQGGVSINNRPVDDEHALVGTAQPPSDRWLLLKRGKKTLAGVELAG